MADERDTYPLPVGLIFIFNLLLGTGVLTMPAVFAQAGYFPGVIVLAALAAISYMQLTFLVEAMANANFISRTTKTFNGLVNKFNPSVNRNGVDGEKQGFDNDGFEYETEKVDNGDEKQDAFNIQYRPETNYGTNDGNDAAMNDRIDRSAPLSTAAVIDRLKHNASSYFSIIDKFELGDMAQMFLNKILTQLFFLSIIVYLLGDLLIYNSMMAKSLRELVCTSQQNCSQGAHLDAVCWDSFAITRRNVYRIFLLMFVGTLLPLTYFGLKKTASIQIITIALRWLAFFCMVGITLKIFARGEASGVPNVIDIAKIPKMFGICVYAFMCHHSVPSILTPVKQKRHLNLGLALNYTLVFFFYLLISITGIFAFGTIQDVYTLNFQINECHENGTDSDEHNPGNIPVLDIFLPTYPIFTLFSSYSMIALSLINNMKVLGRNWANIERPAWRYSFPLIAIIPPLVVSLFTEDVTSIVSYVGSYAGGLIQYVFPSLLVYYSRRALQRQHLMPFVQRKLYENSEKAGNRTEDAKMKPANNTVDLSYAKSLDYVAIYRKINPFSSYFAHNYWLYFTAVWWIISLILVTVDHIIEAIP